MIPFVSEADRVVLRREGPVAMVSLNRPDKRNGLDLPMFRALIAAAKYVAGDPTIRAVVLSGEGKAFCAGLDWKAFLSMGAEGAEELLSRTDESPANVAQRICFAWTELPVPVIAALHGVALGGGFQLALGADLRIAHPDTELSVMEIRYGLVPDMSITKTLPRLVRSDVARELVFTGRSFKAPEALSLGLVTRVDENPLAEALRIAKEIASRSPDAVRAAKRLMVESLERTTREAFVLETDLQLTLLGTDNQREAVMSMLQRREPVFADPKE